VIRRLTALWAFVESGLRGMLHAFKIQFAGLIVWYIFINPIVLKLLHKFLKEKEGTYKEEVDEAIKLIPAIKDISAEAWKLSSSQKGINRIRFFTSLLVYWTLTSPFSNNIIKS